MRYLLSVFEGFFFSIFQKWRNTFAPPGQRSLRRRARRPGDARDGRKRNFHHFMRSPPPVADMDKTKEKVGEGGGGGGKNI